MTRREIDESKNYFLMVSQRTDRFMDILQECQERLPEAVPAGLMADMDLFRDRIMDYLQELEKKDQTPIEVRYFAIRFPDQWQMTCMNNETLLKNGIIIDFEEDSNNYPIVEQLTNFSEKPVLVKIEYQDAAGNLLKNYRELFEPEDFAY